MSQGLGPRKHDEISEIDRALAEGVLLLTDTGLPALSRFQRSSPEFHRCTYVYTYIHIYIYICLILIIIIIVLILTVEFRQSTESEQLKKRVIATRPSRIARPQSPLPSPSSRSSSGRSLYYPDLYYPDFGWYFCRLPCIRCGHVAGSIQVSLIVLFLLL